MPNADRESLQELPRQRVWFAYLLRRFAAGTITNDAFEDDAVTLAHTFRDDTLWSLFHCAWLFYDCFSTHALAGEHKLSRESRRLFARMILLLRSGQAASSEALTPKTEHFWPFKTSDHLRVAREKPTYLRGHARIAL